MALLQVIQRKSWQNDIIWHQAISRYTLNPKTLWSAASNPQLCGAGRYVVLGQLHVVLPTARDHPGQGLGQQQEAAIDATHRYQQRNLRNFVMLMHTHLTGRQGWLDW